MPNGYGIMIKKCCASCQHKCLDDFARRECQMTRRRVKAGYVCGDWEMSEQLEALGCEHGHVQRRGLSPRSRWRIYEGNLKPNTEADFSFK